MKKHSNDKEAISHQFTQANTNEETYQKGYYFLGACFGLGKDILT